MDDILSFRDEHRFLSNFFASPIYFEKETWPTVEHLYQSLKISNMETRRSIRLLRTPAEAKRLGRVAVLRDNWELIKLQEMYKAVCLKFQQNDRLAKMLLETGSAKLVEGNYWHDNFWGNCSCSRCENIQGENNLGLILMNVRSIICHI